ncbi:MAG: hypothetical protein ACI35S_07940 [Anaeroplasma sp.]
MLNLLKSDLKKIIKDKLFIAAIIVGICLAIFVPISNIFTEIVYNEIGIEMEVNARDILFASMNPCNNFGFLIAIFMAVLLSKDFSYGTIRNKIISGNSRTKIFLSLFLSTTIVMCGLVLGQSLLSFAISLVFFDYYQIAFSISEFGYLVASIVFMLLIYVFISAFLTFFCVGLKKLSLGIVFFIVMIFALMIIGSITISLLMVDLSPAGETIVNIINYCNVINLVSYYIGADTAYLLEEVIACILTPLGFGSLYILLGLKIFNKTDIK